jgi:peptidyl-prolyl cis-trans isomerase SurA
MPARNEMIRLVLERMITDKAQLQLAKTSGIRIDDNIACRQPRKASPCKTRFCRKRLAVDGIAYSQFESNLRDGSIGCASAR